jgi:DNA-directed RNA polymerase subunit M/transcription elongation factor TFIIS
MKDLYSSSDEEEIIDDIYEEDQEEIIDKEDDEKEENEDDEKEENEDDEKEEEEEEENEDDENFDEQEEDQIDDFDNDYKDDMNDTMLLLDEEPDLKTKRKKEYNINTYDILQNLNKNKYISIDYNIFEQMIKEDMLKYIIIKGEPSKKNVDILYKNIFECVLNELNINSTNSNIDNIGKIKENEIKKRILSKIRFIYYHIKNCSIKEIQQNIKNNNLWGNLKYSGSTFNTSLWDEYRENIKKEVIKIKMPVEVIEGMYMCEKCGGNLTQSYNVQLRRADEPMTTFITCMNKNCKHKWRKG